MKHTIALCGNPNSGKTSLFNLLTGQNQVVGNWAGVTVEKKEGTFKIKGDPFYLEDLPGIYSLSSYSLEERIARDAILTENPDMILNIVDGSNIERNLYLSVQLLALQKPTIIAVNMIDEVENQGGYIDCSLLAQLLGVPVVPVCARRKEGIDQLLHTIQYTFANGVNSVCEIASYNYQTKNALYDIAALIAKYVPDGLFFYAEKLLEGDEDIERRLHFSQEIKTEIQSISQTYEKGMGGLDKEALVADARYQFIQKVVSKAVGKGVKDNSFTVSERIDLVVTGRWTAIPIFFLIIFIMFRATFGDFGKIMGGIISDALHFIGTKTEWILQASSAPDWTSGLLLDAVIGGVGGVLVFLPQIMILFLFLSVLEDSGYLARAAFIMDRLLRKMGLTGKSFIPMLMGFGCTTPAVMAARTMDNEKDRKMTILLTPFMSCGARLPIYALFAGVFFSGHESLIVFFMYLLGMGVAIMCGLLLKKTVFRGETSPFVMELPPYRIPSLTNTMKHMWEKCKNFLIKAGTIIFGMNVIIWLLQSFTPMMRFTDDPSQSIFAGFGMLLAPIFKPLGFGSWQAASALLTGLVAKESVVGTLSVLYGSASQPELFSAIVNHFTPLSALSFMVFSLLYMPCISAFVSICREMNSVKWALGGAVFQTGVAYIISLVIYHIGKLFI